MYEQYAKIKKEIEVLETIADDLKKKIVADMKERNMPKQQEAYGSFTLVKKAKYIYSDEVKKIEDIVKMAKIEEEEKGIAQIEETEYLTFKAVK